MANRYSRIIGKFWSAEIYRSNEPIKQIMANTGAKPKICLQENDWHRILVTFVHRVSMLQKCWKSIGFSFPVDFLSFNFSKQYPKTNPAKQCSTHSSHVLRAIIPQFSTSLLLCFVITKCDFCKRTDFLHYYVSTKRRKKMQENSERVR
jgi:hypothetical protein